MLKGDARQRPTLRQVAPHAEQLVRAAEVREPIPTVVLETSAKSCWKMDFYNR